MGSKEHFYKHKELTQEQLIQQTFYIEERCLAEAHSKLDLGAFSTAVDLLKKAPRIGTSGCGHSGIASQHLAHLLCCIDRPARFISPAEAVHGGMGFLHDQDVLVLCSRGGKTSELLAMVDIAKKRKVKIISITENLKSPLALAADAVLAMHVNRETDRHNSQGTTSFTSMCVIYHSLQAALIEATGYVNKTFATIHPAGAVGERLNKK